MGTRALVLILLEVMDDILGVLDTHGEANEVGLRLPAQGKQPQQLFYHPFRRALLLTGTRQAGKTWRVRKFKRKHFKNAA